MADSTTNLDMISQSQSQKEVSANAMFDAASPAMVYGRRASTTTALTWGYYGGKVLIGGTVTSIANGTVSLSASSTNYIEADPSDGSVSANTTAFTAGAIPLHTVVTGTSTVSSFTDHRAVPLRTSSLSRIVVTVTYSATTTVDLSPYSAFDVVVLDLTLTGDVTFNLTGGADGQIIRLRVRQDGAGSRIWTSGANLRFSTDITVITLTTTASKLDYIAFEWNGTDSKADVLATNYGF